MTNIVPLNHQQHATLKIQDKKDFTRFKEQHLIPVVVQDFIPLAAEFPIVFVKNTEKKVVLCVRLRRAMTLPM